MRELDPIEKNPPSCVKNFPYKTEVIEKYRSIYRDCKSNGLNLQYNDRHALGELAVMLVEAEQLRCQLYGGENGEFMEVQGDRNRIMKKNPARDALAKLTPQILRLMKEFKMTPLSRKATTAPGGDGSDVDNEFDNF